MSPSVLLFFLSIAILHCSSNSELDDGNPYGGDAGSVLPPTSTSCSNCTICQYPCHTPPPPSSAAPPPPTYSGQGKCPPAAPVVCCGGGGVGGGAEAGGGGGGVGQAYAPPPPFYYPYNDKSAAAVGTDCRDGSGSVHVAGAVWLYCVFVLIK